MATAVPTSPSLRDETRKKHIIVFLLRTLLLMCVAFRRVVALIRISWHIAVGVPVASFLGVARVLFAAANERCLRCMNQAALGRSVTGTFVGDLLVGAMAHSWRVLVQGLTSFVFFCARADEYVRPPPSPLVLTAHDKPAAHPQQVRTVNFDSEVCKKKMHLLHR
jgi:hypothetical protein